MRILMLVHRLPYPPCTGDKVRAYHVARHLARRHELTLAGLTDDATSERAASALREELGEVVGATTWRGGKRVRAVLSLIAGGSATMAYFDSAALRARLAACLRRNRFDVLYVSSSSMAQYVGSAWQGRILMDLVDVDSDKWRQYGERLPFYRAVVYRLEARRLRQHEATAATRADRCLVATSQEAALLHSFAPWVPTTVIPNGVDLHYFTPATVAATDATVIFTGAMDYFPNVDAVVHFCEQVWPRIRLRVPAARFLIVGKNPAPAARRLAAIPGVTVTGTVPDVRPFLWQSAVAVAPLRIARGVQNKILEAMATGLPIVATSKAHQGIEARPGVELFVEDDPGRFADRVVALIAGPALRAQLGRQARRFVESQHSWPGSMAKLDRVLDEVTGRARLPVG